MRLPGDNNFAYPFELDWQIRLSRPRGPAPTEQQMRQRETLLRNSKSAFAEALRLDPHYFSAKVNGWCVDVISGDILDIQGDMNHYSQTQKMSRPELELLKLIAALAAANSSNTAKAEPMFAELLGAAEPATAALARYNLDVLKNGSDQAVLKLSGTPCPTDPISLGLPSVLTLRRMTGAFDGLALGKDSELKLAWENKANGQLLKARIGANRFCILQIAKTNRAVRLKTTVNYHNFNGPSKSRLFTCEGQYLQMVKAGFLNGCGVYYAYRTGY
ncbi:MAG: hypothetical protein JNN28_14255 [Saprospiraceae bacterium]|nr:hypothetical protein [Saprospiraceae bacterium]